MKIGILGTRGIPNHYGGFEQFAEYLSLGLVGKGHEVWVYTSHLHPYTESQFNSVNLIRCFDPENKIGTAGQFIYDFNCIKDSRSQKFDVLLQLGYTSSSIWGWYLPRPKTPVITNMDGLEWKRTKYSKPIQQFLKYAEKLAIQTSDQLISDSIGIQSYLQNTYAVDSVYIPYGANIPEKIEEEYLTEVQVNKYGYYLIIARLEPENNIETIVSGYVREKPAYPLLIVGNANTPYGKYLQQTYTHPGLQFLGGIYNIHKLNSLRQYAKIYFHGHTVGGTNPSLLEAMASGAYMCAHDNEFNRAILGEDSLYFLTSKDLDRIWNFTPNLTERNKWIDNNLEKIRFQFNWDLIIDQYEQILIRTAGLK
jgi:glycosyltransferase involved in cell wall biosynthesis